MTKRRTSGETYTFNIKWYNNEVQETKSYGDKYTKNHIVEKFGKYLDSRRNNRDETTSRYKLSQHIAHKYLRETDNYFPLCKECIAKVDEVSKYFEELRQLEVDTNEYNRKKEEIKQEYADKMEEIKQEYADKMNQLETEYYSKYQ